MARDHDSDRVDRACVGLCPFPLLSPSPLFSSVEGVSWRRVRVAYLCILCFAPPFSVCCVSCDCQLTRSPAPCVLNDLIRPLAKLPWISTASVRVFLCFSHGLKEVQKQTLGTVG